MANFNPHDFHGPWAAEEADRLKRLFEAETANSIVWSGRVVRTDEEGNLDPDGERFWFHYGYTDDDEDEDSVWLRSSDDKWYGLSNEEFGDDV